MRYGQMDWTPLRDEIAKWHRKGLTLPIWWRDDDATTDTAALDRLISLSKEVGVPVHLAVIPRHATPQLAKRLAALDHIHPIVHGWAHRNNARGRDERAEFTDARPSDLNREEATEALRLLQRLMPERVLPVFVPPWNHIDPLALNELPGAGYRVLSTCDARMQPEALPGLTQINTHLDPIAWREDTRLHDADYLMEKLVTSLKRRRQGKDDNSEPFGLLTHHLAMEEEVWDFTRQFWSEILSAPHEIFEILPN